MPQFLSLSCLVRAGAVALAVGLCAAAIGVLPGSPATAQTRLPPDGFGDLAERLTPAVVNIATTQRIDGLSGAPRFPRGSPLERFNDELEGDGPEVNSLGSGFLISADGLVITNNHVIEGADTIEVILQDGLRLPAQLVGRDPATDLAVLRVAAGRALPFVRWGNSDAARVGDLVIAIGNPFGFGGTVTLGIISARNRNIDQGRYDDFIQTDAAINRGNSGGPLFNMAGEVIGVNTAIVSPTGGSVGVGFATPSALAQRTITQLVSFGETRRGWLGVTFSALQVTPSRGAIVSRVSPGGPAARAGLRPGDVIARFDGRAVPDDRALTRMIAEAEVGRAVSLEVLRGGREMTVAVEIGRLDEEEVGPVGEGGALAGPAGRGRVFGMTISDITPALRARYAISEGAHGVVVVSVDPGSDANGKVRPGDVITQIAFGDVDDVDAARALALRAEGGSRAVLVRINRGGDLTVRAIRPN
ncbi:MAG: Do family serine endopeptidase [Caulobacterales bacterium]